MSKQGEQGSAIVLAVFALALLTGMGTALLFLSQHEARMGQASLDAKQAFYLAEAGLEDARMTLFAANADVVLDDDLATAAGADGVIDFDPTTLVVSYDGNGTATFSGYNDDTPLRNLTALTEASSGERGWYAAFLTNDPIDGIASTTDSNGRVMLTGIGAGESRASEIVQAIVEPYRYLPDVPSAAVTMLGPTPLFDNGNSGAQSHTGDNCGAPGGPYAPIVGGVTSSATGAIQSAMNRPSAFTSGGFTGTGTVGNLTDPSDPIVNASGHGTIDPSWLDCQGLKAMVLNLAANADYYCNSDLGSCSIPATATPDQIIFIDGDLTNTPSGSHTGILVITGQLTYNGNTGWDGVILAIGEGYILRNGGGGGNPSGAVVIANIDPTPSGLRADKSDWCSTAPDGFGTSQYHTNGGGNSTVEWCTNNINTANSLKSYRVVEFLQR